MTQDDFSKVLEGTECFFLVEYGDIGTILLSAVNKEVYIYLSLHCIR